MGNRTRWTWLTLAVITLAVSLLLSREPGWLVTPLQAQTNAPPPALAPALPMVSGSFEDAQGRFEVGILEGFEVSSVGGAPMFQAPPGSLAYTVVVAPAEPNASNPELLQVATDVFGQGEGFTTGDVQSLPGGGLRIDWMGQLSQGAAPPQPIVGQILAKQRDTDVFLLMVAATDAGAEQVGDAIATLGSTLKVP
jgi:hypothetical protein